MFIQYRRKRLVCRVGFWATRSENYMIIECPVRLTSHGTVSNGRTLQADNGFNGKR